MNGAHLHLMVNHFPIIGVMIGLLVLIAGYVFRNDQVKVTALGIFIFSALASIAALLTGEGAEEIVEQIAGISETLIHTHEESAEVFFILMQVVGGLSLIALILYWRKQPLVRYAYLLVFLAGLGASVAATYAGASGGEIRHSEIRNSLSIIELNQEKPQNDKAKDDDDD